jgi:hypothetical protein
MVAALKAAVSGGQGTRRRSWWFSGNIHQPKYHPRTPCTTP